MSWASLSRVITTRTLGSTLSVATSAIAIIKGRIPDCVAVEVSDLHARLLSDNAADDCRSEPRLST